LIILNDKFGVAMSGSIWQTVAGKGTSQNSMSTAGEWDASQPQNPESLATGDGALWQDDHRLRLRP
jgi:hypothetical protein